MKKFKWTFAVTTWIIVTTLMWLFVSFIMHITTDLTYKECLTDKYQMLLVIFVYWWLPSLIIASEVLEAVESKT